MATDRENVARAVHVARIEFVNVGQKINLAANPRFRVHESAMVCYLAVLDGLQLGFHSVFGVDCVCHNVWVLWPGLPRAGVVYFESCSRYWIAIWSVIRWSTPLMLNETNCSPCLLYREKVISFPFLVALYQVQAEQCVVSTEKPKPRTDVVKFFAIVLTLYREPARSVGFIPESGYKDTPFFRKTKTFTLIFSLFLKKVAFCRKEYRRNAVYLYA